MRQHSQHQQWTHDAGQWMREQAVCQAIPQRVALAVYAYLLLWLGFIVSTVLLLIFLFKAIEPQRWSVAIGGAVVTAVLAYLLFSVYLGAQLPKGVFEIG